MVEESSSSHTIHHHNSIFKIRLIMRSKNGIDQNGTTTVLIVTITIHIIIHINQETTRMETKHPITEDVAVLLVVDTVVATKEMRHFRTPMVIVPTMCRIEGPI